MHVISRRKLRTFWEAFPDAQEALNNWFKTASKADWRKFADVRSVYSSADLVEEFLVFNICGNKYRLIVDVYYEDQVMLIRHVLTHREYDKGRWKVRPARGDNDRKNGKAKTKGEP